MMIDRDPVVTLDFEASSRPGPGSYPIEAAVAVVSDGTVRSWLIRPELGWRAVGVWDPASERVHGLTLEILQRDGRPVEEVTAEISAVTAGCIVISDAPAADYFWAQVLFASVGRKPPFELVGLSSVAEEITGLRGPALEDQLRRAEELARRRFPQEHRAAPDARRLAEMVRIFAGLA